MSPDWPKRRPPAARRWPRHRAHPGERRRVAVGDGHQRGAGAQRRQQPLGRADRAGRQRRPPVAVQPSGRGDAKRPILACPRRARRERRSPRAARRRNRRSPAPHRAPAGAASRRRRRSPRPGRVERPLRLLERPRRQPEIDRAAVLVLDLRKAQRSITASSSTKAGSNTVSPGWPMPISGAMIDWWAPPSGASVMPDGVATSRKRASW